MQASNLLIAATHLVRVATCLDPIKQTHDVRVLGSAMLLRGLGVENALKALFIVRGGQLRSDGRDGDLPGCPHHDLQCMAQKVANLWKSAPASDPLLPSEAEQSMLETLQRCAAYAGRYPIGRKPADYVLNTRHIEKDRATETRDHRAVWSRARETLFASYVERLTLPFYEGKQPQGPAGSKPITWQEIMRQSVELYACREWIDTGGHVGDVPLSPWATMSWSWGS